MSPVIALLAPFVVMAVYLGSLGILLATIVFARRVLHKRDRRNPLTQGLLRGPGHTLVEAKHDQLGSVVAYVSVGSAMPILMYAMYELQLRLGGTDGRPGAFLLYAAIGFGTLAFTAFRVAQLVRRLRDTGLGLEAELAVGQELNQLMREGFVVFHDIPGDKAFNVDHVVVGPSGIFAVETKGRPKRVRDDGKGHQVVFEQGRLIFPGWTETEPLQQAQRNAEWLQKWLTSAVGEPVRVKPVLVIPGWYIERKSPADVAILNGKNPAAYFCKARPGDAISDKLVKQVVHQLDARCRTVEPHTYAQR